MKIMSFRPLPLLLACILVSACGPKSAPAQQHATVRENNASLRTRDSRDSKTLKVLEPGTKVEVLEEKDNWYRVRLGQTEGWMAATTLLTDDMRDHIQEGVNSAIGQISQNTGVLSESGNLRIDPGRSTGVLRQLTKGTAVEVLERRTIPKEDPKARPDAWLKVRTSPTEVGWLLGSFVEFDVPEGIAPYTEEFVYSTVKTLNEIEDPVAGTIRWYVVGERKPGTDPNLDFTGIRVFTWNQRKQRYETAYRKQGLRGVYPLEVRLDAGKPTFRFNELAVDGKTLQPRDFVMYGVIVRETKPADSRSKK